MVGRYQRSHNIACLHMSQIKKKQLYNGVPYISLSILFYAAMNTYQISGNRTKQSRSALNKEHHTATHLPVSDQVTTTVQVFYQATRIMLFVLYIISAIGNVSRQSYACTSEEPAPLRPHCHLVMKSLQNQLKIRQQVSHSQIKSPSR